MERKSVKSVVIVGGGVGGLFTGAILAKEGMEVTIVEKNLTVGGGLQSFKRFGCVFDTGMHVVGGMQRGGNIRRLCEYLGIADDVALREVDDDCTDKLYFAEDRQWYSLAKGRDDFISSLAARFPKEHEALRRYVDDLYAIADEVDLFRLRPSSASIKVHSEAFSQYADDFIRSHFHDERLRSVVAYMNPLYGGRAHQTPAFVHAIVSVLYIEGSNRFVGGSGRFAQLLARLVTDNGGKVIRGDAVSHILTEGRHIVGVETSKGLTLSADAYISAIHPCVFLDLLPESALPPAYRLRLRSIPNSYSAFSLFVKLRPNSFPYINHSEYSAQRYDEVWNFGRTDKPWPLGFLFMTPPEEEQGPWADKVLVTAPMEWEQVRRWEHTTTGARGDDYESWKQERAERLLSQIEEMHPGFGSCIEKMNTASPLTIHDFYGSFEGGISGYSKDAANLAYSLVPVVSKIDNLFLTGQNVNLHGFCGVALTAIETCEALLGSGYIVGKINLASPL